MLYRKLSLTSSLVRNVNNTIVRCCSSSANSKPSFRLNFEEIPDIINNEYAKFKNWPSFTESVLQRVNERQRINHNNIDMAILSHCLSSKNIDLAEKYLEYQSQTQTKLSFAIEGKILRLLHLKCELNCSEKDQKLILERYDDLRKRYPILDSITLENCVVALSITTRWRECLKLLEEIKISTNITSTAYSAAVSAAFLNKEEDLGFELLDTMFKEEVTPKDDVFKSYAKNISAIADKDVFSGKIERLFNFIKDKEVVCSLGKIDAIVGACKNKNVTARYASVTFRGNCTNCRQDLQKFELSDGQFEELKENLLKSVIVGRDIFVKTNPDELEKFKKFVEGMGKFDVVLDGLNIAYSSGRHRSPKIYAETVHAVISHFRKQNKSVLLLGRVHMQKWPKTLWNEITRQATIFLAQNISQDDPYLLYCAVSSGKDTIIVTRDLMRSHRFQLRDARLKVLFNRWLVQRQHHLNKISPDSMVPVFRVPPPFSSLAQKVGDCWHIPHESQNDNFDNKNYQKAWLCVKMNAKT